LAVTNTLSGRIREILAIDPSARAVEFEGRWVTWGELATTAESVAQSLGSSGGIEVGVILRNTPTHVALLLGVLMAEGCVVTINPGRGAVRTRDEIAALDLPFVAGTADDVADLVGRPARSVTLAAIAAGQRVAVGDGSPPEPGLPEPGFLSAGRPGVAMRMLTSGTTGPPKRVDLTYQTLQRVLTGAKHYEAHKEVELRLRDGVALVNSPLVHLSGLFRILQCVADGRAFALLERFSVPEWLDAVRRHQPKTVSLVPAALRMVLASDIDPHDLSSIKSVVSGTAPLSPADAEAFTDRFGIPVLISYAATEFGGGVAGWNMADHRQHWEAKRGSVGRAHAGVGLRVVDPDTGAALPTGESGLLEVKADQIAEGSDWLRTTDLARLDEDGFLWILGRADQAIIRGGFKVLPDDVRTALEGHPAVLGACVVALDDARLGQVPVAAVELKAGRPLSTDELLEYASTVLARYEIPARVLIVDELPRTPSGKADLPAVRALFAP
jgi:acyl-CoA synthetase (AMP-forming)/AMP-acid ligase II